MHPVKKLIVTGVLAGLAQTSSALVIDSSSSDGTELAATILGSGITISNVTYYGGSNQAGQFSEGSAVLGMESGLVMSSGSIFGAPGPNNDTNYTGNTSGGGAGDSDLYDLILKPTNDAAVLSFDFTSDSDSLFFNYVFASEEYNEYVGSDYNDVFAFFVDGVNIAQAPDGQPVSINTVNCGNPFSGSGPNCEEFNNNVGGAYNIQYDGFTNKLQASISGLGSGTHNMKIALADASDSTLDSAIFIEGGSFSSEDPTPVSEPGTMGLLALGLGGLVACRKRKQS